MKKKQKRRSYFRQIFFVILTVFVMLNAGWAGTDHDLSITDAPLVTSTDPTFWKSIDLKIGADFGDTSVSDSIRRGINNPIYARFNFNGMDDDPTQVVSGTVKIKFHYRTATIGETPPALGAPGSGWVSIGELPVTYGTSPPPFFFTLTWPGDFVGVSPKSLNWTPPISGDKFHIRAEVVYTGGQIDTDPGDNLAISLYESTLGLRDVDVVIVHDASNSMNYYKHDGISYIEHAKARAKFFVSLMKETHNVAVVAFSTLYPGGKTDIWPTSPPLMRPATAGNKTLVKNAITALTAGGATPMGAGLLRAIEILQTVPLDPSRKRTIFLLSDGEENSGIRACPPYHPIGTCVAGSILGDLLTNKIRVYSIALGPSSWENCLECLSEQSHGKWYSTYDPGISLAEVYLEMQQASSTDDLYRVDKGISGGGDDTYEIFFEGLDDVLYFGLAFDNLSAELDLQLRPPGSNQWFSPETVANTSVDRDSGYIVARVGIPMKGTWGYKVTGENNRKYLAAVRSNRVGVRLETDVVSIGEVGSPITIKARLTDQGHPVKDASVIAVVKVPVGISLDTKLRNLSRDYMLKHKMIPVDQTLLKQYQDLSARSAFVYKITDGTPQTLIETRTIQVPLFYDGNGYYSGMVEGGKTTIAGDYYVTVKCQETKFQRTISEQIRLNPGKISHLKSFAEILKLRTKDEKPLWLLRTYPVDQYGNAVTVPSLVNQLKAEVAGVEQVGSPEIVFDSAFQQQLTVSPGKTPKLKMMKIGDKKIKTKNGAGKKCFWKYGPGGVLVLLIIALISL
jgi:hypothetical protein